MQQAQLFQNMRKTGLDFLTDIPWGTHICGFYQTKRDLANIMVRYFKAGLEQNEYCLWVVSEPISVYEAKRELGKYIDYFDFYYRNGQIEILSYVDWYLKYGDFNSDLVLQAWVDKVQWALDKGYEGIRISGNTSWLQKKYFKAFMDYEAEIEKMIGNFKMIVLCTYQLDKCGIHEVIDIVNNHQFSFIKSEHSPESFNGISKYDRINLVGKMVACIAHEIRNPMTTVRGFLQLMQSKKELHAYDSYFSIMIDELDRANDILTEYLSLARDKGGSWQKENINRILEKLLPLIEAKALESDKKVILHTGEILDLYVDPKEFRQLVLNLSQNGIEAMKPSGLLTIRTYIDEDSVVLEVRDEGEGIKQEDYDKIGSPFYTTKEHGTGLGLAVCYTIASRHKATIDFESGPQGTTFKVRFRIGAIPEGLQQMGTDRKLQKADLTYFQHPNIIN